MQFKRLLLVLIVLCSFLPLGFAQDSRHIVRLIYFLPSDRQPQPQINTKMDRMIKSVQGYYADVMEAHGFGKKTFRIETNATGKVVVHRVKGQFADAYYHNDPWEKVWKEISKQFNTSGNMYLALLDTNSKSLGIADREGFDILGMGSPNGEGGRAIMIGAESPDFLLAAHELGHAFGLVHDLRENGKWKGPFKGSMLTSLCTAEWLDIHPYFNSDQAPSSNEPTIVKVFPPSLAALPISIRLRFELTDADGLYQAQLRVPDGVIACKRLSGNPKDTIEFVTTGLKPETKVVTLQVVDAHRNISSTSHPINIIPLLPRPKVISIQDANLASAVRRTVGQAPGTAITTHTMLNLRILSVINHQIRDLSGCEYATFLTGLLLVNNGISDVSALAGLTQLRELYLINNTISDVSALAGLTQLEQLSLVNNGISDVSALAGLTQLRRLHLDINSISDVSALSELTQLRELSLSSNGISDVSALAGLTQLEQLSLVNNGISDVSALAGLTQLKHLHLRGNAISDVSPLTGLNLTGTELDSTGLYLDLNPLSYSSINTHIPAMQARGIKVEFDSRTPKIVVKFSGDAQQGAINATLPVPFVVEVRDQQDRAFAGVPVTFVVITGGGKFSTTTVSTDAVGRAKAYLTLGQTAGTTITRVTVPNVSQPLQFIATAIPLDSSVAVPDPNLHAKIIEALGKPRGETLTAGDMLKLTTLNANNANIHDLTGLQHASNLTILSLKNNNISNIALLAGLSQLTSLSLENNNISDVAPLAGLSQLTSLSLENNNISDVAPLEALAQLKTLQLRGNLLSYSSLHASVSTIQAGGAVVSVDPRAPTTIVRISDTHGVAGTALPLIVEVQDENGWGFSGVPLTFTVTTGSGRISVSKVITDGSGRARTTLTLGGTPGRNTVRATAAEAPRPLSFTITAVKTSSLVSVHDANLRAKIAETLGKPLGAQLTAGDMLALTRLEAPNANIQDLTGLEQAYNLTVLNLGGESISGQGLSNSNKISDFSPLVGLTQLTTLNLSFNSLSDVSFLSGMTQLRSLYLGNNNLSDVSFLSELTQLTFLYLRNNRITDVSSLAGLTQLTSLALSGNSIVDVSGLAGLIQLTALSLDSNTLSNVAPLAQLAQLTSLNLYNNNISDISALAGLLELTSLNLGYNSILDVSSLAKLTKLTVLYLYNNTISDVSALVRLNLTGIQWNSIGLFLERNPLSYTSINTHIPIMEAKGVKVKFDPRTPTTLMKISGTKQQGAAKTVLALPFVVEVRDQQNRTFAGVPVTFAVTAGDGHLSTTSTVTNAVGRAKADLTLGQTIGTTTVRVTATNVSQSVQFMATAILLNSPVTIPDVALRAKIAVALGNQDGIFTVSDMLTLTTLIANNANIRDLTGLQHASNLTTLSLDKNRISDVASLSALPRLTSLSLENNYISDVASLESLAQLENLFLDNNNISDVTPLAAMTQLKTLSLENNSILDVSPLTSLTQLKALQLRGNLLSYPSLHKYIPVIQVEGAVVKVDPRTPMEIVKVSGTHGVAGTILPVIMEVQDEQGFGFSGVPVTFTVTAGNGQLSDSNVITDAIGRAQTILRLDATPGKNVVRATVVEIQRPALFTITAISPNSSVTVPDANLRAKIADTLSKPVDAQLTAADMLMLRRLEAPNANIQDLTGLEHAHNLQVLNLGGAYIIGQGWNNSNKISDFSPLVGLTRLTSVGLSFCSISDVSFLSGWIQLTGLSLFSNSVSDVSPLASLTQLKSLGLSSNAILDVSPLASLTQLTFLDLERNTISDVSPLVSLTQLIELYLSYNSISDVSSLASLTQLTTLKLSTNVISDVSPLVSLIQLKYLDLTHNSISDVSSLVRLNLTADQRDNPRLNLNFNPLSYISIHTHIPNVQAKGIEVRFDSVAHPTLLKISGDHQEGEVGTILADPLVVEAQDKNGSPMQGVTIRFSVTAGGGSQGGIRAPILTTDARGRAQTTLTLGQTPGLNKVSVTAKDLPEVSFTATAVVSSNQTAAAVEGDGLGNVQNADVNGDGVVDVEDLDAVVAHLGQADENDTDVNEDGNVDTADIVLVADALESGTSAPSLHAQFVARFTAAEVQQWLTQAAHLDMTIPAYRRGVWVLAQLYSFLTPKETALLANYPNPFNPETWIPYQLAKPAQVTLHIYSVNGELVQTLALGYQSAGMYQTRSRAAYWDGRNFLGETVASGVYFYTLTANNFTSTRKMLIQK